MKKSEKLMVNFMNLKRGYSHRKSKKSLIKDFMILRKRTMRSELKIY